MFTQATKEAISADAERRGFEPAFVLGFTQVESAGTAYWTVNGKAMPSIRPEGHYFYRNLQKVDPELLKRAVSAGLASPHAGAVHVPNTWAATYEMFDRMCAIDEASAIRSISIGVGQVMGEWYDRLGFVTPQDLWTYACKSLDEQIDIMLRFIGTDARLLAAIKANDFAKVASIYNGPNYKVNHYDAKLAQAVAHFRGESSAVLPHEYDTKRITKLGYNDASDFQAKLGLNVDGQIGHKTAETITAVEQHRLTPSINGINLGTIGSLGAGGILSLANDRLDSLLPLIDKLKTVNEYLAIPSGMLTAGLMVGGAAFIYYKLTHSDLHAVQARV